MWKDKKNQMGAFAKRVGKSPEITKLDKSAAGAGKKPKMGRIKEQLKGLYEDEERIEAIAAKLMQKRQVVDLGVVGGALESLMGPIDPQAHLIKDAVVLSKI